MTMHLPDKLRIVSRATLIVCSLLLLVGCSSTRAIRSTREPGFVSTGIASYYGRDHHGRTTASGQIFDMNKLTAAHRTLPFGEKVRVTNLSNNRNVTVTINDRGPYAKGRIIDLSLAAARKLDMIKAGTAKVRLEPLGR